MTKKFHLPAERIKQLTKLSGGCIASDKILVEGQPVFYMFRDLAINADDSGWHFFAGTESDDYASDAKNFGVYALNTVANYDTTIVALLDSPIESAYERSGKGLVPVPFERPGGESRDDRRALLPQFPVSVEETGLTKEWSLHLPLACNRRVEDGSLVLWRPEFTLWIAAYGNSAQETKLSRLRSIQETMSMSATGLEQGETSELFRFGYHLDESDHEKVRRAFYGFTFHDSGHVQLAGYVNNPGDLGLVRSAWLSLRFNTDLALV